MTSRSDEAFFVAFNKHAECIVSASNLLRQMFENPAQGAELSQKVKDVEHAGDQITHDTIARLHKQWITPLDRSDIHSLISRLDDVLDMIEAVAERVVLFEIMTIPPIALELSGVVQKSAMAIKNALALLVDLKRPQQILELCIEINSLENQADALFRKAIADLFRAGKDPIEVMKWLEIYEKLEAATDQCEDVANILEGVVLEYS